MADTYGTAVKWGIRMEQNLWELRENCHMEETLCKKREELRARRKQLEEKMLELSVEHRREVQNANPCPVPSPLPAYKLNHATRR